MFDPDVDVIVGEAAGLEAGIDRLRRPHPPEGATTLVVVVPGLMTGGSPFGALLLGAVRVTLLAAGLTSR